MIFPLLDDEDVESLFLKRLPLLDLDEVSAEELRLMIEPLPDVVIGGAAFFSCFVGVWYTTVGLYVSLLP